MGVFGLEDIGGSNTNFGDKILSGCKYTSGADFGTATNISIYMKAVAGTINAKAAIYSDNAGAPNALLATSAEVAAINTTPAWRDFTINYAGAPTTVYWLSVETSADYTMYYNAGAANQLDFVYGHSYPTMNDPFNSSGGDNWGAYQQSIHCDYTGTGGGAPALVKRRLLTHVGLGTKLPIWKPQSWSSRFPKMFPKVI